MAKRQMKLYDLYWSPTGQKIASEVRATTKRAAIRKAPRPYSRYRGEIYAEEVGAASTGNKKNRGSVRKTAKAYRRAGFSRKGRGSEVAAMRGAYKRNAPKKMKRLTRSTGWMKAKAVKIVKRRGKSEILIRR